MWADLESSTPRPEFTSWQELLRSAASGLFICVLILAAFAAAGSPAMS